MDRERLLTVREVAERLRVSVRTVWTLIARGSLRPTRIGRCVRIQPAELERLLADGSRP
ncbi:MAG: helix-turn-helix domain-containing protein [Planctomycetes bacterium]|nr:helix-turn-helix domain-containing protein [Planctomycetota bacterium]